MVQTLFQQFQELPYFTKVWLIASIFVSILVEVEFLSAYAVILKYETFLYGCDLYRPLTSLVFYPLSPTFVSWCYCIVKYLGCLEGEIFRDKPLEFAYMMLCNFGLCTIGGLIFDINKLMGPMIMSIVYIWSNLKKDTMVDFYIFPTTTLPFRFQALYLPWVILALNVMVVDDGGKEELLGIVVGHIYLLQAENPFEFQLETHSSRPRRSKIRTIFDQ